MSKLGKEIVENIMNDKFVEADKKLAQIVTEKLSNKIEKEKETFKLKEI